MRVEHSAQLAAIHITECYMSIYHTPHTLNNIIAVQDNGNYNIPIDHITDCMGFYELACGLNGVSSDNTAIVGAFN